MIIQMNMKNPSLPRTAMYLIVIWSSIVHGTGSALRNEPIRYADPASSSASEHADNDDDFGEFIGNVWL